MRIRIATTGLFALLATSLFNAALAADETDRQAILDTDRAFSATSQQEGPVEAFTKYMTEDATWLPINGDAVRGRDAIAREMSRGPAFELTWVPETADVSGDLGYTWGRYVVEFEDPDKGTVTGYGKYTTVWRRQSDGSWRGVLDIGNPSPPPGSEPESGPKRGQQDRN